MGPHRSFRTLGRMLGLLLVCVSPACASLHVDATSATTGKYTSSALAITIFAFDLPSPALEMARNNAADIGQPNLLVERETVFPYLGRLDWLLDIISIRFARVSGTWGYPPEDAPTR